MKYVKVIVDIEDLAASVACRDFIKAYGAPTVLMEFTPREVVNHFDKDSLLDEIGEDAIRDYLALGTKETA